MEIFISELQGRVPVRKLHLKGDLDANSADYFNKSAEQVVAEGSTNILVDMSEVPFMSSAGIRSLHALYTKLHPMGSEQDKDSVYKEVSAGTYSAPHLKLLNPNRKVAEAIKMSGLDMYLKVYQSEQEALSAF